MKYMEVFWSVGLGALQTFAGQHAANQHNLRHYGQVDISFQEISKAVLQQGHIFGRPPDKPFIDP